MTTWLNVKIEGETAVIEFNLTPTQTITYNDIPAVVEKVFNAICGSGARVKVVKVTGRGPIWLYSALTHVVAHCAAAVAVFDAINKQYVVVVTHSTEYKIGQVIE
ncbi:MAG: CRISPR-associated protein Csx3 [Desulfurococcaceae archaeon]